MVLLRKKDDFTNVQIASYQSHADKFFQAWIRLWQKGGITNYIHMIGSGYIAECVPVQVEELQILTARMGGYELSD